GHGAQEEDDHVAETLDRADLRRRDDDERPGAGWEVPGRHRQNPVFGNSSTYSCVKATLTIIRSRIDATTVALTESATPAGPPRVDRPLWQATTATIAPKTAALIMVSTKSPIVAKDANVVTKLPGVPFITKVLKMYPERNPTKQTRPVRARPTTTAATRRGTTRRRTTDRPITSMASISSRILRDPRSAQTAEPAADAMSRAATMGAPCLMTARPLAAPAREVAPTWPASSPNWIDRVTPIGIATNIVGSAEAEAMNAACRTNSANGNLRVTMSRIRYWRARMPSTH